MTELGTIIYNDGVLDASTENARNLLMNGVDFEVVRASITGISEEELKKIYDKVMTEGKIVRTNH